MFEIKLLVNALVEWADLQMLSNASEDLNTLTTKLLTGPPDFSPAPLRVVTSTSPLLDTSADREHDRRRHDWVIAKL